MGVQQSVEDLEGIIRSLERKKEKWLERANEEKGQAKLVRIEGKLKKAKSALARILSAGPRLTP